MRKTIRLTVTLPEHTPTAAMDVIARTLESAAFAALGECMATPIADGCVVAVESLILPDATPSDACACGALATGAAAAWDAGTHRCYPDRGRGATEPGLYVTEHKGGR
jgi:hypothetical protein